METAILAWFAIFPIEAFLAFIAISPGESYIIRHEYIGDGVMVMVMTETVLHTNIALTGSISIFSV